MAQTDAEKLLLSIQNQRQNAPLSVLNQAEPILTTKQHSENIGDASHSTDADSSTGTGNGNNQITPQSLSADLAHYKDLFSKLRFSYLEQVTKEKYLRGIVGEPPVLATPEDNAALEEKLALMKSDLQEKKRSVESLVAEMETLAVDLARKYDSVNAHVKLLETVPDEIAQLETQVAEIKAQLREKEGAQGELSDNPRMNLSLQETERLLEEQRRRNEDLERQINELQKAMPGKIRECERAERELEELEGKRNEVTRLAREVQRRREEGGRDALEEQGRWYKSSEIVLKGLLGTASG